MLPESKLDLDCLPKGPNGMILALESRIDELEAHKLSLRTRAERRPVNKQLHMLRGLLEWSKTRAGYVEPDDA